MAEKTFRVVQVCVPPATFDTIQTAAKNMNVPMSAVGRLCISSIFEASGGAADLTIRELRKAAKPRRRKGKK